MPERQWANGLNNRSLVAFGAVATMVIAAIVAWNLHSRSSETSDAELAPPVLPHTKAAVPETPDGDVTHLVATQSDDCGKSSGIVLGAVHNLEGVPAAGAKVRLVSPAANGTVILADGARGETRTGVDGTFSFQGVPDGFHSVVATTEDAVGTGGLRIIGDDVQWRVANVDVVLRPLSSFPVTSGLVRDSSGDPIEGASVTALSLQTSDWPLAYALSSITNEQGIFDLRFLDSRQEHGMNHVLEATADGYAAGLLKGVEAGSSGNDIILCKGGVVAGRVTYANDGSPASGTKVTARPRIGYEPEGVTDDHGLYSVTGLAPGVEYILTVEAKEPNLVPTTMPLV